MRTRYSLLQDPKSVDGRVILVRAPNWHVLIKTGSVVPGVKVQYMSHWLDSLREERRLIKTPFVWALLWRHNGHNSVSNHQPYDCLLRRLFRRRSKQTSKLRVTGLCAGNSPGPVNFPHKWPVTRKMFPFDDVIMGYYVLQKVGSRSQLRGELKKPHAKCIRKGLLLSSVSMTVETDRIHERRKLIGSTPIT